MKNQVISKFIEKSTTSSGKWAVGFGMTLVILTALSLLFAAIIGGDSVIIENSPLLSVLATTLSIMFSLAGPLSFLVGIYTVIKYKDWSVGKILAVFYVLTLILFLLGEFLFPH